MFGTALFLLPCDWDVMCALAYCDFWDIPYPVSRNIVLQVHAQYVLSLF